MLEINSLTYRYKKNSPIVLDNIRMSLKSGEVGIVLGKNGSGKSTLFKNIVGILKNKEANITIDNKNINSYTPKELSKLISYVPQEIHFGNLTVFDTVLLGRLPYFVIQPNEVDYLKTQEILAELQIEHLSNRNVNELSGGERQKVAIARALVSEPKLIVFDEPTGALDIGNEHFILHIAEHIAKEKNIAILISIHHLDLALSHGDRFFFIKEGKLIYNLAYQDITSEVIEETFDVHAKLVEVENRKVVLLEDHHHE